MAVSAQSRALVFGMSLLNWGIWSLMVVLIASQFLGIFSSSTKSVAPMLLGRDPRLSTMHISGFNDEPYADRAIVCLTQGRTYTPQQLTTVLADAKLATVVDSTGTNVDGIRTVKRDAEMTLKPSSADAYTQACDRIAYTLQAIQDSCQAAGYNVVRDTLRALSGVYSNTTYEIPRALPVLILPYFDNGASMSYAIPATDGAACIFRLYGMYQSAALTQGVLRVAPKDVRLSKTIEFLENPGGAWRNGWYEAPDGQRWYSNMITSKNGGTYGLEARQFDTVSNKELACNVDPPPAKCRNAVLIEHWGKQISTTSEIVGDNQVFATNGSRYGLFLFQAEIHGTVSTVYTLDTFVSNSSIFMVLIRWIISLGAMVYSWRCRVSGWQTTGLGALANSRTFNLLPIVLLPKLKLTLTAFFTVGCHFEGQQSAFSAAWYMIYPGIVEFMLFYYSLLNFVGKLTFRRMSDALFGPTLLALCALHYSRAEIAAWTVLGYNGRLSTLILSDEIDALTLPDFITTNAAMRINGNAHAIFYAKIVLLLVNLLPLVFSDNMTESRGKKLNAFPPCVIEKILALRASNLGGLGRSSVYAMRSVADASTQLVSKSAGSPDRGCLVRPQPTVIPVEKLGDNADPTATDLVPHDHVLVGYEMSRLGYLVFGGRFLLSFDDWYILTSLAPMRVVEKLYNYRITLFEVARNDDGTFRVLGSPHLCRLDDLKLHVIPFYDVTVCSFQ